MLYPELTAEKFIPNPFVDEDDAYCVSKVYKKVDRMRLNEDGELVFLVHFGYKVKILLFN